MSRAALDAAPRGYAIALAWTALAEDDVTMQAALRLARAGDWNEFLAAARSLHAPPQTASYADGAGNIGFAVAGRIPVRKPENDLRGLAPAPGWDALRMERHHRLRRAAACVQPDRRRRRACEPQDHSAEVSAPHHLRMAAALPCETD